jgi:predicted nucleotide-binding protein
MPAEISGFFYESFKNLFNKFYSLIDTDMKKCRYDIITVEHIKHKLLKYF